MAYDTIIPPDFYTSGGWGPGPTTPAYEVFDLDSQQNPGDTSYGDNDSIVAASYWGTNSPGCVYHSAACFAWTEGLADGTSYGIYVGSYDGTTFILLGGPFDAGQTVADPVVATDGDNLYLAYRKKGAGNAYGYEVWEFNGTSWTHLYSYSPTRIDDNRNLGAGSMQGTSGPRLAANPAEPGAVYVGFKEFGPAAADPSTSTRVLFTVTGLGAGATVPGETSIYDDSEPGGLGATDPNWLGPNLEFQVANNAGTPVVLWNAPEIGPNRWVDNAWHLVDVATLNDLASFASLAGDATFGDFEPAGATPISGNPPVSSFPAALVATSLYDDPALGAAAWIMLVKFVYTGSNPAANGQGEWLIVSVRTDGTGWHILDDNPAYANGIAPLDGDQGAAFSIIVDGKNVWLLCANWTGASTVPQFFVMQLERECNKAWIIPYENELDGPTTVAQSNLVYSVLLGDTFRSVGETPDFHLLGTAPEGTFDTAWYSLKICRGCASCQRGLHVWQRI